MRVGILGSGLMGGKLGTIFARAGHEVVFSYSRKRAKLEKLGRAWLAIRSGPLVNLGPLEIVNYCAAHITC
jgi:predicted dinucleotide-binding enzyme